MMSLKLFTYHAENFVAWKACVTLVTKEKREVASFAIINTLKTSSVESKLLFIWSTSRLINFLKHVFNTISLRDRIISVLVLWFLIFNTLFGPVYKKILQL